MTFLHSMYLVDMSLWLVASKKNTSLMSIVVAKDKSSAICKALACEPFASQECDPKDFRAVSVTNLVCKSGYDVLLCKKSNYH